MHTKKNTNTCSLLTVSFRDFPRFTPGLEKIKGFGLFRACVYPDQMSGAVSVWLVPPDSAEPRQTRFLVIMAASIDCTLHFTNQYGLGECHRRLSGVQPQILKTQWWGDVLRLRMNHQHMNLSLALSFSIFGTQFRLWRITVIRFISFFIV